MLTVLNVIIAVFLDFYNVEQDRHRALVEESSVPWRKFLNYKVRFLDVCVAVKYATTCQQWYAS